MKEHIFVNIMMMLQAGAALSYVAQDKWGLAAYWLVCFLTNLIVTYGIQK